VIPAFAPPTWIVLSLFKIQNPSSSVIGIVVFGVIGSVIGRYVMYRYSEAIRKFIPRKHTDNMNFLRKLIERQKLGLFIGTFIYALSPLPSNFIFITSGISGIQILPVLAGFALGRFISYFSLVSATHIIFSNRLLNTTIVKGLAEVIGILLILPILFVNWKKVYYKITRH
jgi:membrane protein YqaA with SNARE-associated domain